MNLFIAIAPIGQIGVAPQVRNRQPGEVNVGPPIQPKLVVPRQATSTPQHIRPAPASSVSTQTITAQNSGTIKVYVVYLCFRRVFPIYSCFLK